MNAMGHDVPTMIGVDHREVARKIGKLVPDYMVMGERGMADMGEMEMPIPDNTAPMMGGKGPFGGVDMGGMFTTVKVRREQKPGDYKDPGWFKHPQGTVADEFTGQVSEPAREQSRGRGPAAAGGAVAGTDKDVEVQIRKPAAGHSGH
ncbi:MAG: copper oxidase, partial [Pseudomonadota bacterium]|nr:copper oxidase [Pseudomonadota bacterium]